MGLLLVGGCCRIVGGEYYAMSRVVSMERVLPTLSLTISSVKSRPRILRISFLPSMPRRMCGPVLSLRPRNASMVLSGDCAMTVAPGVLWTVPVYWVPSRAVARTASPTLQFLKASYPAGGIIVSSVILSKYDCECKGSRVQRGFQVALGSASRFFQTLYREYISGSRTPTVPRVTSIITNSSSVDAPSSIASSM